MDLIYYFLVNLKYDYYYKINDFKSDDYFDIYGFFYLKSVDNLIFSIF